MNSKNPDLDKNNIEDAHQFTLQMLKRAKITKGKRKIFNTLAENKNVRQRKDEGIRRWFLDDYFDFIVWYNDEKEITGFQICYSKGGNEKAITWQSDNVFSHCYISSGVHDNMTAILAGDAGEIDNYIIKIFKIHAINIERDLIDFVLNQLRIKMQKL